MKSIKEKAEKHLSSVYAGYDDVLKKLVKEAYEAGASYVLECFESILPFVAKEGIIYGKIKETIEQLKSNQ